MSLPAKGVVSNDKSVPAVTPRCDMHARPIEAVFAELKTSPQGLQAGEVEQRQAEFGPNEFTKGVRETVFTRLYKQLKSPLVLVLLAASVITFALKEYVDASVILIALLVAVVVGVIQEGRSSRAFEKLAASQTRFATIIRNSGKQQILARDLVIGDIVVLQSGDQVPADVRIFEAKQLSINEAPLTGEWVAVKKAAAEVMLGAPLAERTSMGYMGTFVAEGRGLGVVIAIADATAVGELAKDVREVVEVETPIQVEMARISRVMLYLICALVLIIFAIGLVQGQNLHDMLIMSIAIAVASIPEGMPAAVTIILAVGMEALLKRGGLVRNLLAAETLGSTTCVLTDKTGTLTEGKMAITGVITTDAEVRPVDGTHDSYLATVFDIALAATDAYVDTAEAEYTVHGDPVEVAILKTAATFGVREERESLRARRLDYLTFTSENRFAAGLSNFKESEHWLCMNGAPGTLLEASNRILSTGGIVALTSEQKQTIDHAITGESKQGRRLVAVAYKPVSISDIPDGAGEELLHELVFVGVLIFDDPVREGVAEAIAGVRSAGARILLVTGDNPQTALAIAQQVGIAKAGDVALTGDAIMELSDEELFATLQDVSVFARVLPSQKMRIASVLQQKGEIVAMTGDGINDAPALRRANIGIAIGSGTEVAKEASDLVLIKDSFAVIYAAIEEGRRIAANIQKIVGYLLATSLSEVVLIGAALIVGAPVPILPSQILWSNIIEEGFMSIAFAFEKGDKNAMQRKPHDLHEEGILSRAMIGFILLVVVVHGAMLVGLYFYLRHLQLPLEELRSVMFLVVALDSLFLSYAFRSLTMPFWRVPLANNWVFIASVTINGLLFVSVLSIDFLQEMLRYEPISGRDWLYVLGFSFSALMIVELAKWIFFEREE